MALHFAETEQLLVERKVLLQKNFGVFFKIIIQKCRFAEAAPLAVTAGVAIN